MNTPPHNSSGEAKAAEHKIIYHNSCTLCESAAPIWLSNSDFPGNGITNVTIFQYIFYAHGSKFFDAPTHVELLWLSFLTADFLLSIVVDVFNVDRAVRVIASSSTRALAEPDEPGTEKC